VRYQERFVTAQLTCPRPGYGVTIIALYYLSIYFQAIKGSVLSVRARP
jgi:hypothetical protein